MHQFSLGDIFWFDVGFDDIPSESKIRPAIIMSEEGDDLIILDDDIIGKMHEFDFNHLLSQIELIHGD